MADFSATASISFALVFLEGILSFFSPCVIPLIPIYVSYLAGSGQPGPNGERIYPRGRTMLHTVCFVLGVSFAFFLLGLSFTTLGRFFSGNRVLFTRIGGILIIMLGLYQIGFFELPFLQRERRVQLNLSGKKVGPLMAMVMGFTFSFAWTPCVGPALLSVLTLASSAHNALTGNLLVLVYALGFVIPFLLLGLFTARVLKFLEHNRKLMKYTIKAGGALLILIGIMTFTGWMNGVSSYLNSFTPPALSTPSSSAPVAPESSSAPAASSAPASSEATSDEEELPVIPAFEFTLNDQFGNAHTLSDYKGKVVFLNFWATWCPPCQKEMPDIEKLYKEFGENEGDVVFLGVANPKTDEHPRNNDVSTEEVTQFLTDKGYTFPTVMDETGEVLGNYLISAFPTTFMIDREGNIFGYLPGAMSEDMMRNIIAKTLES